MCFNNFSCDHFAERNVYLDYTNRSTTYKVAIHITILWREYRAPILRSRKRPRSFWKGNNTATNCPYFHNRKSLRIMGFLKQFSIEWSLCHMENLDAYFLDNSQKVGRNFREKNWARLKKIWAYIQILSWFNFKKVLKLDFSKGFKFLPLGGFEPATFG